MYRVAILGALLIAAAPFQWFAVSAEAPANEHFQRTWARTDLPVSVGDVARTWMWGPEAFTPAMSEPYAESPGGQRTVQYYDKSRMEITDPDADPNAIWYVTNGLLVVEMVTGQMQTGNSQFEARAPADVNIAGDSGDPDSPGYADLAKRLDDEATPEQSVISAAIDGDGNLDPSATFGAAFNVLAAHYVPETDHTIAAPFWEFMNSSGTVYVDGSNQEALLFENAAFATGFPISEAYWTEILVGGTPTQVLLQCFERRCLTYTPSNDPAWQVEAGNVGQHYHAWRYEGGQPAPPPGEAVELECVALGYPCSLAASTPEAQDMIFAYGGAMVEMMESGASFAELLDWVSGQPGVVEARGDDEFIRFRVNGGNPAWVYDSRTFSPVEADPTSWASDSSLASSAAGPARTSTLPHQVVGKDLDGDGMTDEKPKRALVLSPFEYSFAPWEAAGDIANMLREARGYDQPGSVQEFRNRSSGDQNVGVSHFLGWNAYSVIYVSSHGGEMCESNQLYGCDSFITTGERVSRETSAKANQHGNSAVFPGFMQTRSGYIGVTNDFFRDQYGLGGIENTIIYLDSCHSHEQTSLWTNAGTLPTLLSGFSSVVFGWELSVDSDHSADAARLIFKQAIEQGTPVARWFSDHLADSINDGSDDATLHVTVPEDVDLRIRETVTMLNPLTGEPLQPGEALPIIGQLGDAVDDQLPIAIRVEGIDVDPGEYIVHVRVNGDDRPETFTLSDGEQVDGGFGGPLTGGAPIYELKDKRVSLGRDVTAGEVLDVMVWVELPEGGETKHSMESPPANPMLVFESSIRSEAPAGFFEAESIVIAEMPLMLNADLDGIEPATYELQYESYDAALDGAPCSIESVLHDGTIEIVDADFPLNPETGKISSFVPNYVVLRPNPDIYADTIIICPQGTFVMPGQDIHWYAGFVVGHEPEIEENGFRFTNWQEGSGDVFSVRDIERSRTEDDFTVATDLHLEIRAPEEVLF